MTSGSAMLPAGTRAGSGLPGRDADPLQPVLHRVTATRRETDDVVTLSVEPVEGGSPEFREGQFNMLTALGVGEVAISISSDPHGIGPIEHTVRDVGAVTHALCSARIGALVGVRGPFGTDWRLPSTAGQDVVVVAGGIGIAPLRGTVHSLIRRAREQVDAAPPEERSRVVVLIGARSPEQIVYSGEMARWREAGAEVHVTVDSAPPGWEGPVGVVTAMIPSIDLDLSRTYALVCGPEVMIRLTIRSLLEAGLAPDRIRISLERNMQCAVGFCGHCQLGPLILCRDGPVLDFSPVVDRLLSGREL